MTIQSVTKLDAAARQLRLAIRLYFEDAEPLGVHTLAGAAHGILEDLRVRRDGPLGRHVRDGVVRPEQIVFFEETVHKAKNFLKHADYHPDDILSFHPDWTELLLYQAVGDHIDLAREITREAAIFTLWVTSKYPTVLLLQELDGIDELRRIFSLGDVKVQKRTFLAALNNESPGAGRRIVGAIKAARRLDGEIP